MDDYLLMSSFDVKFFSASIADDEGMEEEKVDGDDSFNEQNDDWLRVMVDVDNANHTFRECPRWTRDREELRRHLFPTEAEAGDLCWSNVLPRIVSDTGAWHALSDFCEAILSVKEETERHRERAGLKGRSKRRRRRGRPPDWEEDSEPDTGAKFPRLVTVSG
ncbi:hypothetical protein RUM44_006241 [Polyplax serrata]|uniref:Uncharacterized protein n=1 Tax=Polyplax serrata TaxID=468196 RepID=A0ABR1AJ23_POLSC